MNFAGNSVSEKPQDVSIIIDVYSPKLPEMLDHIVEWNEKKLCKMHFCWLNFINLPDIDNDPDDQWYGLSTLGSILELTSFSREDERRCGCLADQAPRGRHVASGYYYIYASEYFKKTVEARGLRGLEFIYEKDDGKYRAPQWYLAIPQECIGRGLDHPWVSSEKISLRHKSKFWNGQSLGRVKPHLRQGVHHFFAEEMREGAGFGDEKIDRLFSGLNRKGNPLVRKESLRIYAPVTRMAA